MIIGGPADKEFRSSAGSSAECNAAHLAEVPMQLQQDDAVSTAEAHQNAVQRKS